MLCFAHGVKLLGKMSQKYKSMVENLVVECLKILVDDGFVSLSQVHEKFSVKEATLKDLENGIYAAVATLDQYGRPVMKFNAELLEQKGLTRDKIILLVAHEAVHLAQLCKGDLVLKPANVAIWKGDQFQVLSGDHPDYKRQPWEAEAFSKQIPLSRKLNDRLNACS